jgi:hypothetical protein
MKRILALPLLWLLTINPAYCEESIRPKTAFNLSDTLKQLDFGTCTLKGQIFVDDHGQHYATQGQLVMLVPLTPYLEEYLELCKEHGRQRVAVDPGMATCGILSRILSPQGHFLFPGVKPGKYLVSAKVSWLGSGSRRVESGSREVYNGLGQYLWSTPIYKTEQFNYTDIKSVTSLVEFTAEGQTINLQLSP